MFLLLLSSCRHFVDDSLRAALGRLFGRLFFSQNRDNPGTKTTFANCFLPFPVLHCP